jgi:hypothetical protein
MAQVASTLEPDLGGPPQPDPFAASGGLRERLQGYRDRLLAERGGKRVPSAGEFGQQMGEAAGQMLPAPERIRGAIRTGIDYIPHAGIRDGLTQAVNSAEMPKSWSDLPDYLRARAGGGTFMQAAKGFNEGLAPIVNLAMLPANVGTESINRIRAVGGREPIKSPSQKYSETFVEGAPPTTPEERIIRAGGKAIGTDAPLFLTGLGLARAGVRSGVTLAEQAMPGVLDKIRSVPVDGITGRLRNLVPDFINSLHPRNVANAFRSPTLQGAADTVMQKVAANPGMTAKLTAMNSFRRGVRPEMRRQAQEALAAGQEQQTEFAE